MNWHIERNKYQFQGVSGEKPAIDLEIWSVPIQRRTAKCVRTSDLYENTRNFIQQNPTCVKYESNILDESNV